MSNSQCRSSVRYFTSDQHEELARFPAIHCNTWNHPVISRGKLYVRNAEELACIELPLAAE